MSEYQKILDRMYGRPEKLKPVPAPANATAAEKWLAEHGLDPAHMGHFNYDPAFSLDCVFVSRR